MISNLQSSYKRTPIGVLFSIQEMHKIRPVDISTHQSDYQHSDPSIESEKSPITNSKSSNSFFYIHALACFQAANHAALA